MLILLLLVRSTMQEECAFTFSAVHVAVEAVLLRHCWVRAHIWLSSEIDAAVVRSIKSAGLYCYNFPYFIGMP
jgi:hypothetical protein